MRQQAIHSNPSSRLLLRAAFVLGVAELLAAWPPRPPPRTPRRRPAATPSWSGSATSPPTPANPTASK
jgi:hypothetical protein